MVVETKMPISRYFKGHGSEVMSKMKEKYGADKGESVFYATANKQKAAEDNARSYAEERQSQKKKRG
jgi:hypothetical protein